MNAKIISAFLVLAFASLACGFNIDMPKVPSAGPEVTDEITVPIPDADEVSLRLSFGAGDLKLAPGAKKLVEGTATYNYAEFEPFVAAQRNSWKALPRTIMRSSSLLWLLMKAMCIFTWAMRISTASLRSKT